jgi:hypothetical protein
MTDARARRLAGRKLIAIDWGVIRAMPSHGVSTPLSNRANYVLPEMSLMEAATTSDTRSVSMVDKLAHFLRANRSSAFIAAHLGNLTDLERDPSVLAPAKSIARSLWRDLIPNDEAVERESIAHGIARIKTDEQQYPKMQVEFEDGREEFGRLMREARAASEVVDLGSFESMDPTEFAAIVNRCDVVAHWVTVFDAQYADPAWQAALCQHSDHAVARWWRVALWYWLIALKRGPEARHRNDWEDSIYVFTASYCNELWTADEGMADACTTLFPHVNVVCRESSQWWA